MKKKKGIDPIDLISFRMEQMDWTKTDLARLTGYGLPKICDFLNRKRKITLGFIRAYHAVADATPLKELIKDYDLE